MLKVLLLILSGLGVILIILLLKGLYYSYKIRCLKKKMKKLDDLDNKLANLSKSIEEGTILPEEARLTMEEIEYLGKQLLDE